MLSSLRIIKERHRAGVPVEEDLVIVTGKGNHSATPGLSVVREEILHVLKAELGLPVVTSGSLGLSQVSVENRERTPNASQSESRESLAANETPSMYGFREAPGLGGSGLSWHDRVETRGVPAAPDDARSDSARTSLRAPGGYRGVGEGGGTKGRDEARAGTVRGNLGKRWEDNAGPTEDGFELVARKPSGNAGRVVVTREALRDWLERRRR